ncbi:hypothetical protein GCM10022243_44070 [Saccharothrix violaceirubra]|uniref:MOSC domain-containing protein YiiM n=1 Tax=Saccharothrix violaceirubra TaxID=413306 RepID=A0A7W7T346_9PSEU|nr:hypothetical protein [Saccharothrix violaceirubra]MBB4965698.1 MOSC domain-containing protein YiiM [Saccharothrix violaceirubra]
MGAHVHRAGVPGAYLRVLEPGEVCAGDVVESLHRPGHGVTVALAFRAFTTEPDLLAELPVPDALAADLAAKAHRLRSLR